MLAVTPMVPMMQPFAPKKPKLSLQTSSLSVNYGCSSRGVSSTMLAASNAAMTPTTMNTFNNTYDLSYRSTPSATSTTTRRSQSPICPRRSNQSSTTSTSSTCGRNFQLPFGIKSILKGSECSSTASPLAGSGTRKVFFPQPKKVSFRRDLEEEIVTKVYVAKHSDLLLVGGNVDEDIMESVELSGGVVTGEAEGEAESEVEEQDSADHALRAATAKTASPRKPSGLSKKQSQSQSPPQYVATSSLSSSSSSSPSASAPTSRKRRRWEWTLSSTTTISTTTSNDRLPFSSKTEQPQSQPQSYHSQQWLASPQQTNKTENTVTTFAASRPLKRRAASMDADDRRSIPSYFSSHSSFSFSITNTGAHAHARSKTIPTSVLRSRRFTRSYSF